MEEENKTALPESTEENATTVELRENYEEAVEKNEKAKKPKKKIGKLKLSLIIVGSFIGVIVLAVAGFLGITRLLNKPVPVEPIALHPLKPLISISPSGEVTVVGSIPAPEEPEEGSEGGAPAEKPDPGPTTISEELQAKLANAMKLGASDKVKAEAAMELYALANANKLKAKNCVMVAQGDGTAKVGMGALGASGSMAVRAFKVQNDGEYYYQKGAKLTNVSVGTTDMLEKVLNKQERAYTSADHTVCRAAMLSGASARVAVDVPRKEVFSKTLPFIKLDVTNRNGLYDAYKTEYTYEEFLNAAFFAEDPLEINNFQYRAEAIYDVTIRMLEDNGQSYYDIVFYVQPKDEATVKVARDYLRESSGSENLEFSYLKVNLRIWDNGFIHSFKDWEKWEGDVDLTDKIGGKSSSDTSYEATFYWDYDSLVADGILEAEDPDIHKETYTQDIINKYASQPGWVTAE